MKLNAHGNKEWDKTIGGSNYDVLRSLDQTIDGGYILGGVSGSNTSGDKSEDSKGAADDRGIFDYWVVKLNATGNKEWDKTIGGAGFDDFRYLQQTSDGGYIMGGNSESDVSGDKSQDNRGQYEDYWIVKLNATGNKEWDKTLGGGFSDDFCSIQQTKDGGYIVGGTSTTAFAEFDKSEDNVGITDYWIVKLAAPAPEPTIKTGSLSSLLYCTGSTLPVSFTQTAPFNSNETFKVQLSNATGSFTSPITIGTGNTSPINAIIPSGISPGKAYRVRVVSSSAPAVIGSNNGTDFIISSSSSYQSVVIKGDYMPCTSTGVYSVSGTQEFTNFTWTLPQGWSIINGQGTNSITVAFGKTDGPIIVEATNNCGASGTNHLFVQPNIWPTQPEPIIASATTVCVGDTVTYTSPINLNNSYQGTYYSWYVPEGWAILSGIGTNRITVKAKSGSGQVSVYTLNHCEISSTRYLEVNSYGPSVPVVTSSTICGPGPVTFTASGAPTTGSYRWYTNSTGGTAIPETTGASYTTPVLSATTTYYVSIVNNSCESSRVPVTATVNTPPSVRITSSVDTITIGNSATFTALGAVSYTWLPETGLNNTTGGTITASPTSTTVYSVIGTNANGCTSIDSIRIVVIPKEPEAIRINAGGTAFSASNTRSFIADRYFGGTNGSSFLISGDILNTTDDALYKTERSSTAFTYSIPVENGPVKVVLHFAEIWFGVPGRGIGGVGSRRFNVDIEGVRKLTNYDIFSKAGGSLRAIQETIPVIVTDGVLNINFLSGAANKPKISAIEVIPLAKMPNVAPELTAIGNRTAKVNQLISFTASASDANTGQSNTYFLIGAPTGAVINPSTGVFTWTSIAAGSYTFTVRVTDNGTPALSDEEQIIITVQNITLSTIRINSGGKAIATSLGTFSADAYLTGTTEVSTKTVAIANTTNDVLYQDYRKAVSLKSSFGYSMPVANGSYTVKLHFAEVFFTTKGKRLFHVTAEGVSWLTNYDIFVAAGGANRAVVASKTITVTDRKLDVVFTSVTDRASISAIEVVPVVSNARVAFNSPQEVISDIETKIYPNPTKEKLMVQLSETAQQLITTITDITGATVARNSHQLVSNTLLQISVNSLPLGIYHLQIQTEKGWQIFRFVKE